MKLTSLLLLMLIASGMAWGQTQGDLSPRSGGGNGGGVSIPMKQVVTYGGPVTTVRIADGEELIGVGGIIYRLCDYYRGLIVPCIEPLPLGPRPVERIEVEPTEPDLGISCFKGKDYEQVCISFHEAVDVPAIKDGCGKTHDWCDPDLVDEKGNILNKAELST